MFRTLVIAILLMAFSSMTLAGPPGFFPNNQPEMSKATFATVLTRNEFGKAEKIKDRDGVLNIITYDEHMRVISVAQPSKGIITHLEYSDGKIPDAVRMVDLQTGRELRSSQLRKKSGKLFTEDEEEDEYLGMIFTISDPFDFSFNDWAWGPKDPRQCGLDDCNFACDMGGMLAGAGCAVFSGPGAVLCLTVVVAAWGNCKQRCSANCK